MARGPILYLHFPFLDIACFYRMVASVEEDEFFITAKWMSFQDLYDCLQLDGVAHSDSIDLVVEVIRKHCIASKTFRMQDFERNEIDLLEHYLMPCWCNGEYNVVPAADEVAPYCDLEV